MPGVRGGGTVGLSRRRCLATLGVVVAAGTAAVSAACAQGGQGAPERAAVALDPAQKREIAFWPRNATDKIAFDNIVPLAQQQFPNLTVNLEVPAGDILGKLKVALAADTPPDSIVLSLTYAKNMVAQGAVPSLQDYLKAD